MSARIEAGLLVIFRYFAAIAMAYFAVIVTYTATQEGTLWVPYLRWSLQNMVVYLALFLFLSSAWLRRNLKAFYLPLALVIATLGPTLSNLFEYFALSERSLTVLIMRSWLLFPILLVPLVLIAWQYRFRYVLLYTVLVSAMDEILLLPIVGWLPLQSLSILGQPLIRAFSYGIIGHIVNHLIETQRAQQRALLRANLELSQHAQTLERLAISRERNRLARELHDTLAHTLSALSVNLEAMKTALDPSQSVPQAMLEQALQIVRQGLGETRRVLKDLRATALEDLGLRLALQNLAEATASRAGLRLTLRLCDDLDQLPPLIEQNLYRICQESLENVARHAAAENLMVALDCHNGKLILTIQDDAVGFDSTDDLTTDRFGLKGMQERAALMGASLDISSRPERGTMIRLTVPLDDDQSLDLR